MGSQNIQDTFLNSARKDRFPITIYLTSGVKLSGRVKGFDKFCIEFESNHQTQLIFQACDFDNRRSKAGTKCSPRRRKVGDFTCSRTGRVVHASRSFSGHAVHAGCSFSGRTGRTGCPSGTGPTSDTSCSANTSRSANTSCCGQARDSGQTLDSSYPDCRSATRASAQESR